MGVSKTPASARGDDDTVRLLTRGEVRPFPEEISALRDKRLFDRIASIEILRRSAVGVTLRIRTRDDLDPRWLDRLEVAVNVRGVGSKTGSFDISTRLGKDDGKDDDPDNIQIQLPLGNPSEDLARFVPTDDESITLVSRRLVKRTFPLTDLPT